MFLRGLAAQALVLYSSHSKANRHGKLVKAFLCFLVFFSNFFFFASSSFSLPFVSTVRQRLFLRRRLSLFFGC